MKKILIVILILIIVSAITGGIYINNISNRCVPDYNENIKLEGLTDNVTVYRDSFAVAHVYAKNEDDLYRAVGYLMAQDRLWQMDLIRRATTGRLSEILGEELIETDLLMRALRIPEKSATIFKNSETQLTTALKAFSNGINQYIENNKTGLPVEFSILGYTPETWQPEHSLNIIGYMAWGLTMPWLSKLFYYKIEKKVGRQKSGILFPDISAQQNAVFPDYKADTSEIKSVENLFSGCIRLRELGLEIFNCSNSWAVSGSKSTTGKPMLANDMHLGLSIPGIWYQMHHVIEGKLDVTGLLLPGYFAIVAGHNKNIAWGFTNVMVDDMDFYLETLNPEYPDEYKFNGEWHKMKIYKEIINIKGGKQVEKKIRFTHRGPVISGFKNIDTQVISMRWIGNEYSNEARGLYLLNRAGNWSEFKDALKTFRTVSQNVVYADINNNIGMYCCAGVPIRKGNKFTIVPGDTDEYDWKGFVPFEELPFTFNPESGYVYSANNKTVGENYPYYISNWFDLPYRADRIKAMLTEKQKLSVEDFISMQADNKSVFVEKLIPDIIKEINNTDNLNTLEKQCIKILSSWDGSLTEESSAAVIFEEFYILLIKNIFKDEMEEDIFKEFLSNNILVNNAIENIWKTNSGWYDDITTDIKENFSEIVNKSFKEAVNSIKKELGSNPGQWEWGNIHKLNLKHPLGRVKILDLLFDLNRGPFEVGGSYHTVCAYSYTLSKPIEVDFGVSNRHIYSMSDWDKSLTVIPTGNSGIPANQHYCDQTTLYIKNKYHNDLFSRELIKKKTKYYCILSPE